MEPSSSINGTCCRSQATGPYAATDHGMHPTSESLLVSVVPIAKIGDLHSAFGCLREHRKHVKGSRREAGIFRIEGRDPLRNDMATPQIETDRNRLRVRIEHACQARIVFAIAISQLLHERAVEGRQSHLRMPSN